MGADLQAVLEAARRHREEVVSPEVDAWNAAARWPRHASDRAGALGLTGLLLPRGVGRAGLSLGDGIRVYEELGKGDGAYAFGLSMHNICAYAVCGYGTEAVQQEWARELTSGRKLANFSLTEPQSGSDAAAMRTRARINGDGTWTDQRRQGLGLAGRRGGRLPDGRQDLGRSRAQGHGDDRHSRRAHRVSASGRLYETPSYRFLPHRRDAPGRTSPCREENVHPRRRQGIAGRAHGDRHRARLDRLGMLRADGGGARHRARLHEATAGCSAAPRSTGRHPVDAGRGGDGARGLAAPLPRGRGECARHARGATHGRACQAFRPRRRPEGRQHLRPGPRRDGAGQLLRSRPARPAWPRCCGSSTGRPRSPAWSSAVPSRSGRWGCRSRRCRATRPEARRYPATGAASVAGVTGTRARFSEPAKVPVRRSASSSRRRSREVSRAEVEYCRNHIIISRRRRTSSSLLLAMPPGRPRAFDSDHVLDAAMRLFWHRGYRATTTRELEQALGLGQSSIANAFGTKADLVEAALARYQALLDESLIAPLREGPEGLASVDRFLADLSDWRVAEGVRGCLIGRLMAEGAGNQPRIAARIGTHRRVLRAALDAALQRAVAAGEIPPEGLDERRNLVVGVVLG